MVGTAEPRYRDRDRAGNLAARIGQLGHRGCTSAICRNLTRLVSLLPISLGAVYAFMAPATYTAEATVVIDPRRVQLFPKATFSEGQIDSPALESEIELVNSEPVALSVINDLGLAKNPEVSGSEGVFGAVLGFASDFFSASKPNKPLSESEATRVALGVLSKNLAVKRVGIFYHLSIQYQSGNPNRAAQIANAIAGAYIVEQLEGKYDSTKRAAQWMQGTYRRA